MTVEKPTHEELVEIAKEVISRTGVPRTPEEISTLLRVYAQELRHLGYVESAVKVENTL